MGPASFDEIFGPGEFDEVENRYEREFLGTEAGYSQNVLDFKTVWEHAKRHGYDTKSYPNGNSKDLMIQNGNIEVYLENFPDGLTKVQIEFDEGIDDIEAYMRESVGQWLGEIIRREQKVYRAATNYVHNILSEKADEKGLKEQEILSENLDFPKGGSLSRFHEEYRSGMPTDIGMAYAAEFELWPFENEDADRSDLQGKMPSGDEIDNPELRSRNDLYQRKFLETVVKEADREFGIDEGLKKKWLEYVDTS